MKRELAAFFQEVCRLRPLVLFLDDVHWADASTIDVLAYVLASLESSRLFVVVTYRPTELHLSRHPFLSLRLERHARRQSRDVELGFLRREDIALLVDARFPGNHFPPSFGELVHRKTEGNPLFIVNLLSYLQERGVVREEGGGWCISGSIPDLAREIPESVRSMVERKIDQLSADDRVLLAAAAVQGAEFDSTTIATALSRDAAELESRFEALDRVHDLVRQSDELELPNGTLSVRYRFVHIVYHDALYASLSPSRRVALSARVASAVLDAHRKHVAPVAAQVGFLFETARDYDKAAEYFQMAATHAGSIYALHEAIALARRSIGMLERLPPSGERLARELTSQLTIGYSTATGFGYAMPEVATALDRARALAEQLGEHPQLVPALWGLWAYYCTRPQLQDAREVGERLLRIATTADNPVLLVAGHAALGIALQFLGHWEASHSHFERAIEAHDPSRSPENVRLFRWEPGVLARSRMVRTAWVLGRPDEASEHMQAVLELARETGDPRTLALALVFVVTGDQLLGRAEDALAHAKLGIAICDEHGIAQERAWLATYCGWAVAETQDVEEGIRQMQASIATLRGMHAEITLPFYLGVLAETQAKHGRGVDALQTIQDALAISSRTGDVGYDAYLLRLRGELELGTRANETLRAAIELARTQGARAYELRAATALARLSA
jgi:tetratricopeptide (TPR) repeat protein